MIPAGRTMTYFTDEKLKTTRLSSDSTAIIIQVLRQQGSIKQSIGFDFKLNKRYISGNLQVSRVYYDLTILT